MGLLLSFRLKKKNPSAQLIVVLFSRYLEECNGKGRKRKKFFWTSDETLIIALSWWLTGLPEGMTFPFSSKTLFSTSLRTALSLQVCCCVTGRLVRCRLGALGSFGGLGGLVDVTIVMLVWCGSRGVFKNFEPKPFVDFLTCD